MPMRITPYASDADAQKAAQPKKLKTGWHRASIDDAVLRPNKNGDDMIDARFVIVDDEDNRWEFETTFPIIRRAQQGCGIYGRRSARQAVMQPV